MNKDWSKMSIRTGKKNSNIYLDDKPLLSIEKKKLEFKNKKIALLLKEEIESSRKNKNFNKLFYFNILSFGIDKVKNNKTKYLNEIFKYIDTDLICYRAEKPDDLFKLQIKMWNPVLDRLAKENLKFNKFYGVMPRSQPKSSVVELKKKFNKFKEFEISSFLKLTKITGSILLSYSLLKEYFSEKYVFDCSVLDEKWQSKQWGELEEMKKKHKEEFFKIKKIKLLFNAMR